MSWPGDGRTDAITQLLNVLGSQLHTLGVRFAAREDLHATDVQALSHLAMAGGSLTAGDLARSLELSTGATTRLVDRLEAVGHVARHTDPEDRRRRTIAVTPQALETAASFFGAIADTMRTALQDYSDDDLTIIERFLADVIAATATPPPVRDELPGT